MSVKEELAVYKKQIKWFWRIFFIGAGVMALFILLLSLGVFGKLPSFDELENPNSNIASEIISSDGKTIGKFAYQNRIPVKYKDLPKDLVNALVSTEDERFYEH